MYNVHTQTNNIMMTCRIFFPALISRQMKNNTDKNNPTFGYLPINYFYILYYVTHMLQRLSVSLSCFYFLLLLVFSIYTYSRTKICTRIYEPKKINMLLNKTNNAIYNNNTITDHMQFYYKKKKKF